MTLIKIASRMDAPARGQTQVIHGKITIRKSPQRLCQSRQKTGVGQLSMPEEAKIPSGRFFDASDFGRLASWRAVKLSNCRRPRQQWIECSRRVCVRMNRLAQTRCKIAARSLQDRCKIAARYYVAISFIASYARPAWPKAIFYSK